MQQKNFTRQNKERKKTRTACDNENELQVFLLLMGLNFTQHSDKNNANLILRIFVPRHILAFYPSSIPFM